MVRMEEEHFPQGCAEQTKTSDVHPLTTETPGSGGFSACQSSSFLLFKCPNCLHPAPSYLPKEKDSGIHLKDSFKMNKSF